MRLLPPILLAFAVGLTGVGAVEITQPPAPVVMAWAGEAASLSVQATGMAPVTYQWHRNGLPIAGATGSSYAIASMSEAVTGLYSVSISDGAGDLKMAFSRVALPGALLQYTGENLTPGEPGEATAVPTALSDGDVTMAISSTGGLLWTAAESSAQSLLETPPPNSQPADLGPVVQLAVKGNRLVALQADGTVRAWTRERTDALPAPLGTWTHTPITLPLDASRGRFVAIDAESIFIVRWDGTLAVVSDTLDPLSITPPGLTGIAALSTASRGTYDPNTLSFITLKHALALRTDGTVTAWGENEYHQTETPAALANVVEIVAGAGWSLALKSDGSLVQWGAIVPGGSLIFPVLGSTTPPAGSYRHIRSNGTQAFAIDMAGQPASWQPVSQSLLVLGTPAVNPHPPAVAEVLDVGLSFPNEWYRVTQALCRAASPAIEHPPENTAAFAGETMYLSVEASGRPLPHYQWLKDGTEISGATDAVFKITDFQGTDAGSYTVRVTNLHGTVTSSAAVVSLALGPTITTQPQSLALHAGQGGTLTVAATGSGTLSYRWFKDGRLLPSAIAPSLAIASGLPPNAGVYQAEVTDATGSRRSQLVRVGQGCAPVGWHNGQSADFLESVRYAPADVLVGLSDGEGWFGIGANGHLTQLYERIIVPSGGLGIFSLAPTPFPYPVPGDFVSVAVRNQRAVALDRDGVVSSWRSFSTGGSLPSTYGTCIVPVTARNVSAVCISAEGEALALRADGRVIGWQTPWGTLTAVPVALNSGVTAISSGYDHHLALKTDGTVIAWGDDAEGECDVPPGLTNVTGIAALENVSFAIHTDGSLTAWGSNANGECDIPAALMSVASLRGARGTVMATKTDGTLLTWGAGAVSTVPSSLAAIDARHVGIMPVVPPPPGGLILIGGNTDSYGVALVPVTGPRITLTPLTLRVFPGFSGDICAASASGYPDGPYTGVWQKNAADLPLTTTSSSNTTLSLTNVTTADAGQYRMAYSSAWGTSYSQPVQLEVVQPRLFSDWQAANFTPAERASGLDAPNADPGGFGISNLMRYAFGLDAHVPDLSLMPSPSYLPAQPSYSVGNGLIAMGHSEGVNLTFSVPQDTADVAFIVESSADLQTWIRPYWISNLGSTGTVADGRRQVTFSAFSNPVLTIGGPVQPQRFFRIAVEPVMPGSVPLY